MAGADLRAGLLRELRRHPRVEHQGLCGDEAARARIAEALPTFVPFRRDEYAGCLWVVDWDHHLPSRALPLRLYAYYTEEARRLGASMYDDRRGEIAREDLFPEFDVPDFSGLTADEAYEAELPLDGPPRQFKLVSEWRRDIEPRLGRRAQDIVRRSHAFMELSSEIRGRAPGLGDLEAAEWAPPPESGHARWGIDVWYLRQYNGMIGEGTAFLVDIEAERVVSQRDFQFRAWKHDDR